MEANRYSSENKKENILTQAFSANLERRKGQNWRQACSFSVQEDHQSYFQENLLKPMEVYQTMTPVRTLNGTVALIKAHRNILREAD